MTDLERLSKLNSKRATGGCRSFTYSLAVSEVVSMFAEVKQDTKSSVC